MSTKELRKLDAWIAEHQNGPPLEKYENQWNKAMRLTELVLPRAEAWLVRKVTLDETP